MGLALFLYFTAGMTRAADRPSFSLVQSNRQWRLSYQLPQTNGSYQVRTASKIENLMTAGEVLSEWDAQEPRGARALPDFYQHAARFFGVRHVPMFAPAAPILFELPAAAPYLVSHPLIFDGRLYAHTTVSPLRVGPQFLSCYDLRQERKLLWSTLLGDDLFAVNLMDKISWNLMRSEDVIPLVVIAASRQQRFMLVNALSGEITTRREIGTRWPYIDSRGRPQSGGVNAPGGNLVEHGDEVFFPDGTMLCKCSGEVQWSNKGWILFGGDAIIARDIAYGFDSGASLRIKAIDLSQARPALTGFAESDAPNLFSTDAGSDLADSYATDHFLIAQGRIYKGRSYTTAMAGPKPGQYLEEFSATNGAFLRRAAVEHPANAVETISWKNPLVPGYMQTSGNRLLVPWSGQIHGVGDGKAGRIYAFDTASMTQAWSFTYAGLHTHAVPTRDHVILVEELYERASGKYTGFRLLKVDLLSGALQETFENPLYSRRDDYKPSASSFKDATGQSALSMEQQPLLYQGALFLPVQGPSGSAFWIIDVGDPSANLLQYKFNNQLNPVLNLAQPGSNQDADPIPANQGVVEQSTPDQTGFFSATGTNDLSLDKPAQAEPVPAILSSLGIQATNLARLERGYVALLEEVKFSNNGEDSLNNLGEGYLRLRTRFGCEKTAMRYPWRGFLGLHYEPPSILNGNIAGPDFRAFAPRMPLFYRPAYEMEGANSSLYLSYSALEDDHDDTFGKIASYFSKIARIALSYLAFDYCQIAAIAAETAAQEASDYTQSFGTPFLTIFNGAADTIPHRYGIPAAANRNEFRIAASATRGILVAAADAINGACAVSDLANGDVSALDNVVNSTVAVFDDQERSTRGIVGLHSPWLLRVKSLSVTLNRVDLDKPGALTTLNARIGLLGEDALSAAPAGAVSTDDTPFRSYVKHEQLSLPPNTPLTNSLYSATLSLTSTSHGSLGVFTELDVATVDLPVRAGEAAYSETRFFQDILFGAWDQDPKNPKRFTKTVTKPLNARTLRGYVTLTYGVLLDP